MINLTETGQQSNASDDVFPASFGQQRLWFLNQLDPASSFYNIPLLARLKGRLNVEALQLALNAIVARHEALRTTFSSADGQLLQSIAPTLELNVKQIDLSTVPDGERESIAEQVARAESETAFDLSRGPLVRVTLAKLRENEHLLLVSLHHICADGWSVKVFLEELSAFYNSYLHDEPAGLPELEIQYADWAAWQRELLQGVYLEKQLEYWRQQLAGAPPLLILPTDRARPAVQTFSGERRRRQLPGDLQERLSELSRREGATLFMTLLAAFQTLLYRYSGSEDLVVGSPSANRNLSETKNLIGFFVNTLTLRTDFSGNPSFLKLLKRVRQVAIEAYANQEVPLDWLVDELKPERSLSYSPLFQVVFSLETTLDLGVQFEGLETDWLEVDRGTSKFDLALFVSEHQGSLTCTFEYDTDLFDSQTIDRMLDHFQILLESIVSDPQQRVGELPLLTQAEIQLLTNPAGAVQRVPLPGSLLHEVFATQVARMPGAIALTHGHEQITYDELNRRANQLAHHLIRQAVGPDVLVGLCLERSVELIVGLLAILKAGGAYLPLDPAYPAERLLFMLADAGAKLLLTTEALAASVNATVPATFLLDRDWQAISHESTANPGVTTTPEHLAYVIYTSGSTGKPKGVPVSHRNVMRLFEVTEDSFGFTGNDVWTLFHSAAFDFSVWEIWGALLYGGRLVVVPYFTARAPEEFLELLRRERVTVLNQTPSAFRQLARVATAGSKQELALRYVVFGGEALELQSLKPWFDLYGDGTPQLVNMYGITETTVHVTYRPLTAVDLEANTGSVIGRPLGDLRVYLLDQRQQLVPIGVPGEMYVGGGGLSRGYLHRHDLTAERFVPDVFSNLPGAKLYRSGDLARRLANGDLEYLGRVDRQVKIRGFRIELGEIEAVLRQAPGVEDCVVLAGQDSPASLLAYLVLEGDASWALQELRNFASAQLPDYMVPSFFMQVERIPLTANGKVDQRALPLPETAPASTENFVAPRSETEKKLAAIWSELLGRDQIGINDNFFELGGHSLLATQAVSRVRDTFSVRLTLRNFFENPTVASLAELVTSAPEESSRAARSIRRLQRDE